MKAFYGVLVFSLAIVVSLAETDWEAIKGKYAEVEANWRDHAQKAMEALRAEDALNDEERKQAEAVLHSFVEKGQAFYKDTVYKHIEEKNLTAKQAEEFRDQLTELAKKVHEGFTPFRNKAKKETQDKLVALADDSEKYRHSKVQEVVKLLGA